ncbi:MAG TPA: hypothetical protein VFI24_09260 [Pyrinomonadaceae bacterium]|nr:hypothetical protein [Pyrinomonadaceae bacterium]
MSSERMQQEPGVWEWLAAVACFLIGALSLAIGFVLTTDRLLDAHLHPSLHALGIVLLIIGIPVIILGGHCMDLGEKKNKHVVIALSFVSVVFLFASTTVQAQQTIFNVPSTDVLDKGKVYAELDASLKPADSSDVAKFSSFVPRVVIGAGSNIEFGLNVTGNIQPGSDSTTLVPTIKWKPFQRDNGWAMVVGDNLFVPVRNRGYNAGNYVYAEFSKTFKQGTRITFGGYDFTRNVVAASNRAGGQFGFEQPLNKKITFAADWLTGKHSSGYFTPGIIFKAGPKITGYAGYSIGNQNPSGGNHFFLLELGYNFN